MGCRGPRGCGELLGTVFGFGVCVCASMCGYAHPSVGGAGEPHAGVFILLFFIREGAWPVEVRGQVMAINSPLPPSCPWDLKDIVRTGSKHLSRSYQPAALFFETQSVTEPGYLVESLGSTCLKPQALVL